MRRRGEICCAYDIVSTFVPVRFFAQAFGLTVQWDEQEQTAVLYDREALTAALDERFTVVNAWLAAQPVPDGEQARYTAAAIRVLHTAFDSIDGDKQYTPCWTARSRSSRRARAWKWTSRWIFMRWCR